MPKRIHGRRPLRAAAIGFYIASCLTSHVASAQTVRAHGVPLGGIGCGSIELLPDGSFGNLTLNGNEVAPVARLDGCFAAIWTRAAGKTQACVLQSRSAFGLPCAPAPAYRSVAPGAALDFSNAGLPIAATMTASSPIVPQDVRASSLPAAFVEVDLRNPGKAPAEVAVAFSWAHLAGAAGRAPEGTPSMHGLALKGNTVARYSSQDGLIGLRMDPGPIPELSKSDRQNLNTRGSYLFAIDAHGLDAEVSARSWSAAPGAGSPAGPSPSAYEAPSWWSTFAATGEPGGQADGDPAAPERPMALVVVRLTLKPGERRTLPFVFAWHTPRRYLPDGTEVGRACLRSFDDVADIAQYAAANRQYLAALTAEWQERIRKSTVPAWLAWRLVDDVRAVVSNTLWTRDSGGEEDAPGPQVFAVLSGTVIGDTGVGWRAQPVLSSMAPALDRLEMRRSLDAAAKSGALPASLGDLRIGLDKPGPAAGPLDVAAFLARVDRLYRATGNKAVATDALPALKPLLQTLGSPGAADGLAGALAHAAAADLARTAGDAAQAVEWERGAGEWRQAAGQPAGSVDAVQLWASILDISLASAPVAASGTPDPVAGAEPSWARAAWLIGEGREGEGLTAAMAATETGALGSWLVLEALAGAYLDVPAERLRLTPALPGTDTQARVPVFAPTYWATVTRQRTSAGERVGFWLDRVLPGLPAMPAPGAPKPETPPSAGLDIREVVLSKGPAPRVEVAARRGLAPLAGTQGIDARGRLVFAFEPPIHLVTGQRLEFVLKPR